MWPDRVSNPRPQTNESGALHTALRGRRQNFKNIKNQFAVVGDQNKCCLQIHLCSTLKQITRTSMDSASLCVYPRLCAYSACADQTIIMVAS